ncbi:MAG: type II secretion system F family protein [Magnetococcales bacterium]|nr:type II secretion system F family protein [Magnetococcales bacterium]
MATVKLTDLLVFTNQFASMMRSNLALVAILENLARETPQKELREVIEDISINVQKGVDFGDCLTRHPRVFDDVFVSVVRAGMASGKLAASLTQIAEYLGKADAVTRKVKSALSYPIFMLVAFFGVFNAMVFFILPRFETMFRSFGKKLPAATQLLLDIGAFWKGNWYWILGAIAVAIFSMIFWVSTSEGRYLWDRHKLRIPIVGRLWRMASLSRFLRTLSVQLQNEVSLLLALQLSASSANNRYIEDSLLQIASEVERGGSITMAFQHYEVFSGIVLQMISAGEEAGTLDELLLSAADYFERLLDNEISIVTGLINPVLTIVMGMGIAGMMIAAFLPVFEMGSAVGKGK